MAIYVLVHGGAHGGWCYQKVSRLLRADGHEVYTPTMTGLGERSHLLRTGIDLELHIRDIVAVLRYEDLHNVILVGHSYGGMVITGAADHAAERIGKLVYLDAANPKNNESLVEAVPIVLRTRETATFVDGVELVLHPGACFEQKLVLTNEHVLQTIPQFHIVCTRTLATRDPELMAKARAEGRLWDIDTGHDLMITEPEKVAGALLEVAAA